MADDTIMKGIINRKDKLFLAFMHEFEPKIPNSNACDIYFQHSGKFSSSIDYILQRSHHPIDQFLKLVRAYMNMSQHDHVMAFVRVFITAKSRKIQNGKSVIKCQNLKLKHIKRMDNNCHF